MSIELGRRYNVSFGIVDLDMTAVERTSSGSYVFAELRENLARRITEIVVPYSKVALNDTGIIVDMLNSEVNCYFPSDKRHARINSLLNKFKVAA